MVVTSLVACTPKEAALVPTCPEVAVVDATPAVSEPPVPPEQVDANEREPDEAQPEELLLTRKLNNVTVTVRVGERKDDSESDDGELPGGYFRLEVTRDGVDGVDVIERDIEVDDCLFEQLELDADMIFADGEVLVFEVNRRCVLGEVIQRMTIEHMVLATWEYNPGVSVLYEGTTRYVNNDGVEVSLDKREFYVEMGKVAVYQHTVKWCDEKTMKVAHGDDRDCGPTSPRKLKLLKRLPITVPVEDE